MKVKTGIKCGGGWISRDYNCLGGKSQEANLIADAYVNNINKYLKNKVKKDPKPVVPKKKLEIKDFTGYEFEKEGLSPIYKTSMGNKVKFIWDDSKRFGEYNAPVNEVVFTVNDKLDYDASAPLPREEKLEIAGAVKEMWNQLFEKLPEDSIFMVEAHGGDERQKIRLNAYKKLGFIFKLRNNKWYGYGVKVGGKLLSPEDAGYGSNYSEANNNDELFKNIYEILFGEELI